MPSARASRRLRTLKAARASRLGLRIANGWARAGGSGSVEAKRLHYSRRAATTRRAGRPRGSRARRRPGTRARRPRVQRGAVAGDARDQLGALGQRCDRRQRACPRGRPRPPARRPRSRRRRPRGSGPGRRRAPRARRRRCRARPRPRRTPRRSPRARATGRTRAARPAPPAGAVVWTTCAGLLRQLGRALGGHDHVRAVRQHDDLGVRATRGSPASSS